MGAPINMIGLMFGRLVVECQSPNNGKGLTFSCRCDCGNSTVSYGNNLRRGVSKSCGCLQRDITTSRRQEVTGIKFGRLTVTGEAAPQQRGRYSHRVLDVKCECGIEKTVWLDKLKSGKTQSCGCLAREKIVNRTLKHGDAAGIQATEYRSWKALIARCENQNIKSYKNYGGRGIKVCERWRNSYENFLADMGRKPTPDLTIERINNDGNYEPTNCRWATRKEQRANQRPARRKISIEVQPW